MTSEERSAANGDTLADADSLEDQKERRAPVELVAGRFVRGDHGHASLPTALSAAARRMDPTRPARAAATLVPILESADIDCARMTDARLLRWAIVVHALAVLSGTAGAPVCSRKRPAGRVMAACGYSEHRFARLLTARGEPLSAQVVRLARYLRAAGGVPLDLRAIADLVLEDGEANGLAERARLRLARDYFGGARRADDTAGGTASDHELQQAAT